MKKCFITIFSFTIILLLTASNVLWAQPTQTLRGRSSDRDSKITLIGATIILQDDTSGKTGTVTDVDGNFILPNLKVGKHNFKIKYIGYQDVTLTNIVIRAVMKKL